MDPIRIRDLETGEILIRYGAVAEELLASHEPLRDEDGEIVLAADGKPEKSHKRYVRAGAEPRKWKDEWAAKQAQSEADQPEVAEENPTEAPRRRGSRRRSN